MRSPSTTVSPAAHHRTAGRPVRKCSCLPVVSISPARPPAWLGSRPACGPGHLPGRLAGHRAPVATGQASRGSGAGPGSAADHGWDGPMCTDADKHPTCNHLWRVARLIYAHHAGHLLRESPNSSSWAARPAATPLRSAQPPHRLRPSGAFGRLGEERQTGSIREYRHCSYDYF
jgi:hypothetical protein